MGNTTSLENGNLWKGLEILKFLEKVRKNLTLLLKKKKKYLKIKKC